MRVLFTSWAWASHYFPLVPLGWAFRAAGHDVCVASQPALADVITRSGLPAVAVGQDIDFGRLFTERLGALPNAHAEAGADWADMRRRKGMAAVMMFIHLAERMVDEMTAFARKWQPDLVVYEPTTYAGLLTAAGIG